MNNTSLLDRSDDPSPRRAPHPIQLRLSNAARRELGKRGQPLVVQLELLFSCMIRKQALFPEDLHADAIPLACPERLIHAGFRAIGTKACMMSEQAVPDHQTFPIQRIEPFLPKWLNLDFRSGRWHGEFGYVHSDD